MNIDVETTSTGGEFIRILIVDHDMEARHRLRDLVSRQVSLTVAAECERASEAAWMIDSHDPDLVFMELQLPDANALDWLEARGPERMPPVVITAREGDHAAKAFDLQVIDYLIKPVNEERVQRCLDRYRTYRGSIGSRVRGERSDRTAEESGDDGAHVRRVAVGNRRGGFTFVAVDKIDWIDAAGNYVRLNVGDHEHLLRSTMSAMERQLDPRKFIRIHRSTIVNVERIQEVRPRESGEHLIVLEQGQRLNVGRSYRHRVARLLGLPHYSTAEAGRANGRHSSPTA